MNRAVMSLLAIFMCSMTFAQDIFGKWKSIEDKTGKEKSIVNIYKENGKVYGKIIKIFDPSKQDIICI